MPKVKSKKNFGGQKGFPGKCYTCHGQGHRKSECPKRDNSHVSSRKRQREAEGKLKQELGVQEFGGNCYICHGHGHRKSQCPNRDSRIGQEQQQAAKGKTLDAVPKDADITKAMAEGETILERPIGTPAEIKYAEFEERVRRTVYLDNLSTAVTAAVLKTALGQFGNVTNVQFISNYKETKNIPLCALVEMETSKQARSIASEMADYPFMMSGMPRPVRARAADVEMFDDRPSKPSRKIQCRWVDSKDPDFETAKNLKALVKKHAAEASLMLELQLAEEEKLAKQQAETLKVNYKKYEMMDNLMGDGTLSRLARRYNLNINDD